MGSDLSFYLLYREIDSFLPCLKLLFFFMRMRDTFPRWRGATFLLMSEMIAWLFLWLM